MKPAFNLTATTLLFLVLMASCRKDPPAPPNPPAPQGPMVPVKLTVKPIWDDGEFNKQNVYLAGGDQRVQVTALKFYLSPLQFEGPGPNHALFDADLFDVVDGAEHRLLWLPVGNYSNLRFGLGLPPALNHRDLATIPPNAPTGNNSGMYWNWATQYRFVIFSGFFDNEPDSTGQPANVFDFHTGLDTCYRTRALPFELHAAEGDTVNLTLTVDIARFFQNGNAIFQLSDHAFWHGVGSLNVGTRLADMQVAAFAIEP